MSIFQKMAAHDHEEIVFCNDASSGLKAIIAIHNTTLGPALGGSRMWPYETAEEALEDVLRLSRGMTYKAAVAGLDLGGGKTVIIGDQKKDKSEALFRALGRFIEGLNGRYITAEDVGTSTGDMADIARETNHVRGCSQGAGGSGDPSPVTAFGALRGLQAAVKWTLDKDDLEGLTVAIQGAGQVGYYLAKQLAAKGCKLVVADIDDRRTARVKEECGARVVGTEAIFDEPCDVFSPCALGAILNSETIPRLKCKIVAGAANNQIAREEDGDAMVKRGILYAPDYIVNAGGLISVWHEGPNYNRDMVMDQVDKLYDTTLKVFELAENYDLKPEDAAQRLAEQRIAQVGKLRRIHRS
ncbi:MAG: leucine dehydrogenase [Gemmatimonadetes bacterium]|nr:leucine dehydrogenase [Gemmatimonadota bacterium]